MTTNAQPLTNRFVVMLSDAELEQITAYGHQQRLFGRSEAARRILAAGVKALRLDQDAPASVPAQASIAADTTAPAIPEPDQCGRPVLGELILPWLRKEGRNSYELAEVVQGVFGDTAAQPGRDKAVQNVFKAIGWKGSTSRRGGVTTRTYSAPAA